MIEPGRARRKKAELAPAKTTPVTIAKTMSTGDAFARIVHAAAIHMRANERGVLSGADPEFLHQMRVAVRRLRSAFTIFPDTNVSSHLAAEAKWLAGRLAEARDWDVFLFETLPRVCESVPKIDGFAEVFRRAQIAREAALREAQHAVASERYEALRSSLLNASLNDSEGSFASGNSGLHTNVLRYAEEVLERRYARVLRRGRSLEKLPWSELHALRIAVKKLRYAVGFFQSLFDRPRTRLQHTRLTALQDILGLINDGATTQQLVRAHFRADSAELAPAIGIIAGWAEGRSCALRDELAQSWKAFRDTKVFWR